METLLLTIGFGLVTASILALSAVSFTLQYAVSRVANLAHGEFLALGAYAAYLVQKGTPNVAAAALAAALTGGVAGLTVNFALIERFAGRPAIVTFIATLGLSLVLQNVLVVGFGAANVAYTISQGSPHKVGPFQWTSADIMVMVAALTVVALLFLLLRATTFGTSLRAIADNRELARVSGIPVRRVIAQTWFIAGMVAGFAGFVLAETVGTFGPTSGFSYLLITITATVAGGLGRPYGTLTGALVVGMVLELAGAYTNSSYELAFAFAVLVLLVLFRPNGLFAFRGAPA